MSPFERRAAWPLIIGGIAVAVVWLLGWAPGDDAALLAEFGLTPQQVRDLGLDLSDPDTVTALRRCVLYEMPMEECL